MFGGTTFASRKFIDLIFDASSKYANWDPPKKIHVGDFGTIDKNSGQLEVEGNIYELPSCKEIAGRHPSVSNVSQNEMIITSVHVKRLELTADPQLQIPGLAEAKISGRWEFGTHRGALLIMDRPRIHSVPPKVLLKELVKIPELQDRVLVTEITTCPAYTLYLSQKNNDRIDLALRGQAPVPAAAGLTAGGGVSSSWWTSGASGVYNSGTNEEEAFTPLYVAKKIRKPGLFKRELPRPPPKDDELFVDAFPPWDLLDSEGEEVEYVDDISDDDE